MNNVQEFLYENSPIRMIESNGETWWVLKDICKLLSIENHKNITKRLEEDEVGTFELPHPQSKEKKLEMLCVNESGLYSVILRSDKPEAKAFRRWITHEILPEIHRTGEYNAISTEILEDSSLTAASKTIFLYLCRCAKGKSEFVISRSKVLNDLKMGTDMYTNHLNKIKQSGYISSEPCRNEKGRICGIKFYINYPNSLKRLENNGFRKLEHE
ncbi:MAG: Bro-N domain-containing protein [Oscillospiraceae bacterium]